VVHVAVGSSTDPCTVGFVVSRAVGGAVDRNLVKRRLRGLMAERVALLPAGSRVVVRALPGAAGARSDVLGQDLDHALRSATRGGRAR
jgi:ribonuclease P protein component